jgi:hypothetical protein
MPEKKEIENEKSKIESERQNTHKLEKRQSVMINSSLTAFFEFKFIVFVFYFRFSIFDFRFLKIKTNSKLRALAFPFVLVVDIIEVIQPNTIPSIHPEL